MIPMFARTSEFEVNVTLLERLQAVIAWLGRFPLALLQLAFRFSIASVFWHAGMTKIASWDTTISLFRDEYMVPVLPPQLAATMAATVELSCPVLLVLGLATRLATLPMLGMTFVIEVFVYPEQWIEHLMWASILLFILTRGPGPLALDHVIARAASGRRGN
jgi:putative oxidoreductase